MFDNLWKRGWTLWGCPRTSLHSVWVFLDGSGCRKTGSRRRCTLEKQGSQPGDRSWRPSRSSPPRMLPSSESRLNRTWVANKDWGWISISNLFELSNLHRTLNFRTYSVEISKKWRSLHFGKIPKTFGETNIGKGPKKRPSQLQKWKRETVNCAE